MLLVGTGLQGAFSPRDPEYHGWTCPDPQIKGWLLLGKREVDAGEPHKGHQGVKTSRMSKFLTPARSPELHAARQIRTTRCLERRKGGQGAPSFSSLVFKWRFE